jgi:hypothetical protein
MGTLSLSDQERRLIKRLVAVFVGNEREAQRMILRRLRSDEERMKRSWPDPVPVLNLPRLTRDFIRFSRRAQVKQRVPLLKLLEMELSKRSSGEVASSGYVRSTSDWDKIRTEPGYVYHAYDRRRNHT